MTLLIIMVATFFSLLYLFVLWMVEKAKVKPFVIEMICAAEVVFSYGDNLNKFNYVFSSVYDNLPPLYKTYITKENVRRLVQRTFSEVKQALDIPLQKDKA